MDPRRETLEDDIRKYLDIRLEELKLRTVDGLSAGVSRVLSMMVVLMLGAIVLAAFAFGTVLLLGDLIGSWAAAAFIIGGVFLIVLGPTASRLSGWTARRARRLKVRCAWALPERW